MGFYSQSNVVAFDFVLITTIRRRIVATTKSTIHFYNLDNSSFCFLIYTMLLRNVYFFQLVVLWILYCLKNCKSMDKFMFVGGGASYCLLLLLKYKSQLVFMQIWYLIFSKSLFLLNKKYTLYIINVFVTSYTIDLNFNWHCFCLLQFYH
jgi:hypothetical protein